MLKAVAGLGILIALSIAALIALGNSINTKFKTIGNTVNSSGS
ncbi:hypothetical protein [Mesorhizobium australicum]